MQESFENLRKERKRWKGHKKRNKKGECQANPVCHQETLQTHTHSLQAPEGAEYLVAVALARNTRGQATDVSRHF